MPRGATQSRNNLSSASTNVASMPNTKSRRAFGDVSNKGRSSQDESKKSDDPPLRRSRRLSIQTTTTDEAVAGAPPRTTTTTGKSRTTSSDTSTRGRSRQSNSNHASKLSPPSQGKESRGAAKRSKSRTKETGSKRSRSGSKSSSSRSKVDIYEDDASSVVKRQKKRHKQAKRKVNPCTDILQDGNHTLQRESFDDSKFTAGISCYDEVYKNEIKYAPGYMTDIYQRLFDAEFKTMPHPYMEDQPELNGMMRAILIDWIVEVHLKFRLVPETLYLAINIIDRYLEMEQVQRKRLQLVGVTALLIACKYEEIYPPEVKDCVYITDRAYTRQDVLDMEAEIVKTLKFRMTVPTGYPFLRRFLHICNAPRGMKCLANFYMERMLQENSTLNYRPSLVAATAVSLSLNNPDALEAEGYRLSDAPGVPESLLGYTGFDVDDIKEVAVLMQRKVGEVDTTYSRRSLNAVKKKYAAEKYDQVSTYISPTVGHLL